MERTVEVLIGSPASTRSQALQHLDGEHAAWVGPHDVPARSLLGSTVSAIVLDAHEGFDADALAQVHGALSAGGCLVVRRSAALVPNGGLAAWPHGVNEVGTRLARRVFDGLAEVPRTSSSPPSQPRRFEGSAEQARAVASLAAFLRGGEATAVTLVAARGRGKSSAVGLALATAGPLRVAVTGPSPDSVREVLRFWGAGEWMPVHEVPADVDVVVVDEAAQLPIPVLQALVARTPARLVFATTVGGYEGTGRGFALRFGAWLRRVRPVVELTLSEPIRWAQGDPLEAAVDRLLCLDATPAPAEQVASAPLDEVLAEEIDRARLVFEEQRLRDVFGLLMHAHYRTTPSDLHRMLDAPNLAVHALWLRGRCVAACVVAREGALAADLCHQIALGGRRLRGHALPETLMCHGGEPDAGQLSMVRSVRLAVHPALRRRGLARRLVDHVHRAASPDLFGTMFGAVPEVVRMRRDFGYRLVRVGASRGARTGEPTAVMVRPVSREAHDLVERLRGTLAREWPLQATLLEGEGWPASPALAAALGQGLGEPTPWTEAELAFAVQQFADGPRPYESCAAALREWVSRHPPTGTPDDVALRRRVTVTESWEDVARAAGLPSVPAAMRAVKRGVRALRTGRAP